MWPLLCALAAVGVDVIAAWRARLGAAAAAVALGAAVVAALHVPRLTFAEMGSPGGHARVVDHGGAYNRALAAAHDRPVMSWLHRHVRVYGREEAPKPELRHYNYTIELGRDGSATLVPLGFAACAYDWSYDAHAN